MKIYTKTGDKGKTALLSGQRVTKNHPMIEAYGTVDECNSTIGAAQSFLEQPSKQLQTIQETLFDIGAALSLPLSQATDAQKQWIRQEFGDEIELLEEWIDEMDKELPQLKHFILPGGHPAASLIHMARTFCRRAERLVTPFLEKKEINESILIYLNRLSDYLFTKARMTNQQMKTPETEWKGK